MKLPPIPSDWKKHLVANLPATSDLSTRFSRVLDDAEDERPVQDFLSKNPELLSPLVPLGTGVWVWDRPRLGSEFIPDFLACTRNSSGCQWVLFELESPIERPLIQTGLPGKKLREAQGQIRDWRIWLRQNISYAETELGFRGLNAEANAVIVIGRRKYVTESMELQWRELSEPNTSVMTYDRLSEAFSIGRDYRAIADCRG
ncbi:MAG: Shedu anti-phage system protein SduA domain-containing protein [Planctomycetota bacterium]